MYEPIRNNSSTARKKKKKREHKNISVDRCIFGKGQMSSPYTNGFFLPIYDMYIENL